MYMLCRAALLSAMLTILDISHAAHADTNRRTWHQYETGQSYYNECISKKKNKKKEQEKEFLNKNEPGHSPLQAYR